MKLFGSSGIRGVVFEKLTPEFCMNIGKAIGSYLKEKSNVCIATDSRLTGDFVKTSVSSGLLSTGVNVCDMGIMPTSVLAFLTRKLNFDTGIMITASHNPPEFNGIKLWNKNSMGYVEQQEDEIEKIFFENNFRKVNWKDAGNYSQDYDAKKIYIEEIKRKFPKVNSELKILVDAGNGAASGFASRIFKLAGLDMLAINDEPNGMFPGRDPEPKALTLKETIKTLKKENIDLAVCFDGDADRVVLCDKDGFVGYNECIAFIARLTAKESKKRTVVTTVETGRLLDFAVKDIDCDVVRGKVGDVKVAQLTKEKNACIGVEQVGHYIVPEMGYYPDVIYPVLFLLGRIKNPNEIREFFKKIPRLYYVKEGVECSDDLKSEVVENCEKFLKDFHPKEINMLDGIRMEFEDSWVLIRASGTQPLIRVIVESETEEKMKKLLNKSIELVKNIKENVIKDKVK